MCQGPIKLRQVSPLPILVVNSNFRWEGEWFETTQAKKNGINSFIYPSIYPLNNFLLSTNSYSGIILWVVDEVEGV